MTATTVGPVQQRVGERQTAAGAPAPVTRRRPRLTPGRVIAYLAVVVVALLYLLPLVFLLNTAMKTPEQFTTDPVGLTKSLSLTNFGDAWREGSFGSYVANSLLYTLVASTLSTLVSLLIAFPVSRGYIRFSKLWNVVFVVALFLPNALTTQFQLMLKLGLYDSRVGYILLMSSSLGVGPLLIIGYLRSLPRDLDEAAAVDGCGYFRYLFTFVVPLAKPVLATVFILHAISVWNDIILATVYLAEPEKFPMTLGLFSFYGQYGNQWSLIAAATLIVAMPLIVIYAFLQRYFVAGAVSGAVKS